MLAGAGMIFQDSLGSGGTPDSSGGYHANADVCFVNSRTIAFVMVVTPAFQESFLSDADVRTIIHSAAMSQIHQTRCGTVLGNVLHGTVCCMGSAHGRPNYNSLEKRSLQ